jgi:DNA-binding transcriptional ArsR family regulator
MATDSRRRVQEELFTWDKAIGQFVPPADLIQPGEASFGRSETKIRHHRSRFLKGPVPWDWIIRASELPGRALIVGLCLWRLSGAVGNRTVTLGNAELQPFGIDRAAKSRALTVLESAGLVTVERKRGRLPIVTLPSQAVSTVGQLRPLGLAKR